jgi:hypothetical protein
VIEKALSHENGGIAGIYSRAEYAKQRTGMLQWWADYLDSFITESMVIVGNFTRHRSSPHGVEPASMTGLWATGKFRPIQITGADLEEQLRPSRSQCASMGFFMAS